VHHLGEVAGSNRPGVDKARRAGRLERLEDGHQPPDVSVVSARHQRVAVLQSPDATGYAAVDVSDTSFAQEGCSAGVVRPSRVAPLHDDVVGIEQPCQLMDVALDGIAVGDHDPDVAWGSQAAHQGLQGGDIAPVGIHVETDDVMAAAAQPLDHVRPHLAQTHESQLHDVLLLPGRMRGRPTQAILRPPVHGGRKGTASCGLFLLPIVRTRVDPTLT